MIGDAIALIQLLRDMTADAGIVSAIFDPDGNRMSGDDSLAVIVRQLEGEEGKAWFYEITGPEGYEFVRSPVNPEGVIEAHGTPSNETNPDARYFRYAPVPDGHVYGAGTRPNVRVNFMVFGYRPEQLLSRNN